MPAATNPSSSPPSANITTNTCIRDGRRPVLSAAQILPMTFRRAQRQAELHAVLGSCLMPFEILSELLSYFRFRAGDRRAVHARERLPRSHGLLFHCVFLIGCCAHEL